MKTLYFDCSSGISGDMTLGALTDLGVPTDYLIDELGKLGVDGFSIEFCKAVKNGITANSANVIIEEHREHDHSHDHDHGHDHGHDHCGHNHSHDHEHDNHEHNHDHEHDNHEHKHGHAHQHEHGRSHADIVKIIKASGISDNAKKLSLDIFKTIAEAEAKVHGTTPEDVHFHEVGALDSIVDIVGAAVCVDYLKPDKIISSVVNDGFGFTFCQHGKIPVPVPAVMEIFAAGQVKMKQIDIESELVTPTGAGIIATLSESFERPENLVIKKIGYGAGKKDLDIPNVLRVCMCEEDKGQKETITVIEASIDDQTPESLGFAMERLLGAGANDVFFTPIQMKKNRPAVLVTVLCENNIREKLCSIIFQNTSTIGMRFREENRICLPREFKTIETELGKIDIKISRFGETEKATPEYESAKEIALEKGISIDEVYRSVYAVLRG